MKTLLLAACRAAIPGRRLLRMALLGLLTAHGSLLTDLRAAQITLDVTITNAPTYGHTFTLNGDLRAWVTNTPAARQMQVVSNSPAACATNFFNSIATTPFSNGVMVLQPSSNVVRLVGPASLAMSASLPDTSWGYFTATTNTSFPMTGLRLPLASEPSATVRTNLAALLVDGINAFSMNRFLLGVLPLGVTTNAQEQLDAVTGRVGTLEGQTNLWNGAVTNAGNGLTLSPNSLAVDWAMNKLTNDTLYTSLGAFGATNAALQVQIGALASTGSVNSVWNFLGGRTNAWDAKAETSITNGLWTLDGGTQYVNSAIAAIPASLTNLSTSVPFLNASVSNKTGTISLGSGVWTNANLNSATLSGSVTAPDASSTAPSAIANVGTLKTLFPWAQSYYVGQLRYSTYNSGTLTLTSYSGKTVAQYGTNAPENATIVWSLPTSRLKGKSIVMSSLWVNFLGATGDAVIEHTIYQATNNVWIGGYPAYRGGNYHVLSKVTVTNTVPTATNQFWIVTTNTISPLATDAEASLRFIPVSSTISTNIGLIEVGCEEIP